MNNLNHLLTDPSFLRWAEGEAEKNEALFWDSWIKESEFNRKLALRAQSELFKVSTVRLSGAEPQWQHLLARIQNSYERGSQVKRNHSFLLWVYRAAAIVLIFTITGVFTYQVGMHQQEEKTLLKEIVWQQVETDYAEQKKINLTDGSSIILGSHSLLEYPEGWVLNNSVEVRLEGEAYFQVAKKTGNEPVFRVRTTDGMIEVLGTRFVVDADENRTRVVLEEGAVSISEGTEKEVKENDAILLKPNEMAEFSGVHSDISIREVNTRIYTSWTNEVLELDNTSFRIVTDRVRKTFGVNVRVNNPELYNRRLTGSLNLQSADHLMNAVSEVFDIEVQRIDDTIVFGTL
ncbi:MAG: FecR domain-containing protein [Balneolaceae bacterium]